MTAFSDAVSLAALASLALTGCDGSTVGDFPDPLQEFEDLATFSDFVHGSASVESRCDVDAPLFPAECVEQGVEPVIALLRLDVDWRPATQLFSTALPVVTRRPEAFGSESGYFRLVRFGGFNGSFEEAEAICDGGRLEEESALVTGPAWLLDKDLDDRGLTHDDIRAAIERGASTPASFLDVISFGSVACDGS